VLPAVDVGPQRDVLELVVPGGADTDRAEQFLLRQRSRLLKRERWAGLLPERGRQWPMRANAAVPNMRANQSELRADLRGRLCRGRRRLLSGRPGHVHRRLLPPRRRAKRPEQERVQAVDSGSASAELLRPRADPDRRRPVLRA
jgi:hypothetical protein